MALTYRTAKISDLKDIQNLNFELCKKEFKEFDNTINVNFPLSQEGTNYFKKRIIDKDAFVLVALDNEDIVGYIVGAVVETEDYRTIKKMGEAENMVVREEYRSKGIGSALLNDFLKWCKLKKVTRVRAVVSNGNAQSLGFHKKNGFFEYNLVLEKII